jgi:LmbE family N-acetylglucosaminyl deacetylase
MSSIGAMNQQLHQTTTTAASLGTILSVWAHPDDETYLAGGVMAAAREAGNRVVCVTATSGERGTDDPTTWPPARLGQVRRWEASAAMAVLGVDEHRVLGMSDGALDAADPVAIERIGALLDEVRPDTILTFGPDGITYHSDHIAVHHWVIAAWLVRGRPCRLLQTTPTVEFLDRHRDELEQWNMYMTDERPTGVAAADAAVHVRLTGDDLDRKLTALRALATQTGPLIAALDPDVYAEHVAEECFVDTTTASLRRPRGSVG